ncbi:hypothetical protein BV22DRAFT_1045550 [Leucogyrophana mollusca]|uniref:Uncharacterized protein n=1 Tax=Leucogyrophana mollusca TaxID=85980 RepID=A0ACB8BQP5_9AGAM|nr:hypothetical protein BV22DRAFT_1045550 [Leucogyrophana mollusca]
MLAILQNIHGALPPESPTTKNHDRANFISLSRAAGAIGVPNIFIIQEFLLIGIRTTITDDEDEVLPESFGVEEPARLAAKAKDYTRLAEVLAIHTSLTSLAGEVTDESIAYLTLDILAVSDILQSEGISPEARGHFFSERGGCPWWRSPLDATPADSLWYQPLEGTTSNNDHKMLFADALVISLSRVLRADAGRHQDRRGPFCTAGSYSQMWKGYIPGRLVAVKQARVMRSDLGEVMKMKVRLVLLIESTVPVGPGPLIASYRMSDVFRIATFLRPPAAGIIKAVMFCLPTYTFYEGHCGK